MIIDEKMIRDQMVTHAKCDETCPGLELRGKDVVETLEKLWKVARAVEIVIKDSYWKIEGRGELAKALSALHADVIEFLAKKMNEFAEERVKEEARRNEDEISGSGR